MLERPGYVKNVDPYLPCLPRSTVFSPIFNKKLLFATFYNKKYIMGLHMGLCIILAFIFSWVWIYNIKQTLDSKQPTCQ